ncbi:MAG: prephenate dehydrogenase [Coriobacteriales bacterium]|jgi:prephenate dehydrogenase|nr:prephenate dehydrogenase [Coriobacteriales bacterium]
MNIGIVGLGLIGGSFAKSTKARTMHTVLGIARSEETMMLARMSGAIDAPLTRENIGSCDLIFLALLPHLAVAWIEEHLLEVAKHAVVVDLCGVKRTVSNQIQPLAAQAGFTYIGGHPMAGKERGGFVNSSENLFEGASMILAPDSNIDINTLEDLKNYFLDVGFARLTFTTPQEHDRIIAYTSQLAHIASSAYVRSPEALRRRGFSAGSFGDMTRVARLDEDMWSELFCANADFLSDQLGILIDNLSEFKTALDAGDSERLRALLREGREIKARIGEN